MFHQQSGGADLLRVLVLCAVVDQPVLEDWLLGAGPAQSDSSGAQVREAELSGTEGGQSCVGSGSRLHHWRHSNKKICSQTGVGGRTKSI